VGQMDLPELIKTCKTEQRATRHLNIDHQYKSKQGKVYINGIEGFWSFAKERLMKHHGISKEKFLYYIKEMEWRYNNREKVLFVDLIHIILEADC
jgi:transposase